jgi:hypothetical protein
LQSVKFIDNTISSLTRYRYSAQYVCFRGNIQTSVNKSPIIIYPDFHDILISDKDKQLAIRYNAQITSMTPVVNRIKIDTLGGRYPKFVENAVMNYKTFQISGLISAEEDFNRQFLDETTAKYRYDIEQYHGHFGSTLLIRNDTDADGEITYPNENQIQTIDGKNVYSNGSSFSGQLDEQHDSYPHNH